VYLINISLSYFPASDIENLANKVQEKLKESTPKEGLYVKRLIMT